MGSLGALQQQFGRMLWGGLPPELAPTNIIGNALRGLFSPYQSNPLDINPLRDLLERRDRLRGDRPAPQLKVFVSATHVTHRQGRGLQRQRSSTPQAVMASACLPMLFQAVEIDGEAYWDGGYSVNPALSPLIDRLRTAPT